MKLSVLAILAAPILVLAGLAPHGGPAAVIHHHQRGRKAHPAAHYHGKRGPAKARRCAARSASISLASVSSTSVLAQQTTTTTTEKPQTTTTTEKPKPTDNNNDSGNDSGNSSGKTYSGDGTFYSTGLNACGTVDKDTDMIAAIGHGYFDNYPGANGDSNDNPICNKQVTACYQSNCVTVRITDSCMGCAPTSLDFSPSAFQKLADPNIGRIHNVQWHWD